MTQQESFIGFVSAQAGKLLEQTLIHIGLTFISLLLAVMIALPLGIVITRSKRLAGIVLGIAGVFQTIPSIALLGFMIPVLGIGAKPAIAALFLYSLLPVIRNVYAGIMGVDSSISESAKGMGMSYLQVLLKVQLPIAMPVIFAGIRTATIINIGVATLAAYIGAGGLGEFIFGGIALNNTNMILAGAIPAALLAILADYVLSRVQRLSIKKLRIIYFGFPVIALLLASLYLLPGIYEGKLLAGFTPEFMGRADGYPGLKERYGLNIRTVVISDAVMYKSAFEKKLDVISGYSTDGRLKAYDLVILNDDKTVFPPYYAAPIVREDVLTRYPELEGVLNMLAGRLTDSMMTELNYRADYLKQTPETIAKNFLVVNGLWKAPRGGKKGQVRIGSKIFGEQYILSCMYTMLIKGYTDLDVVAKAGLGGTKICFDALMNNQLDLYPEYTGTGLLVLLKPAPEQLNSIINNKDSVYSFVSNNFRDQYHIKWLKPIGFNNSYALMMRRKQANELGISNISGLKKYLERK